MVQEFSAASINRDAVMRYKGYFDLDAILKFIKKWMVDRNYTFYERKFKKKPDLIGSKYDILIETDKRINAYVKWFHDVRILAHDVQEKEVIENGKKVKKEYGRIKLIFNMRVQLDPDKRWETPLFKKLEEYSISLSGQNKWEFDMIWWDELYYDMYQLKEDFSRFMGFYFIG